MYFYQAQTRNSPKQSSTNKLINMFCIFTQCNITQNLKNTLSSIYKPTLQHAKMLLSKKKKKPDFKKKYIFCIYIVLEQEN